MQGLRSILFAAACLAESLSAQAQVNSGEVSGYVVDASTNTKLSNAVLYIPELNLQATASASGYFDFARVPGGRYRLIAGMAGFVTDTSYISVAGGNTVTKPIYLVEDARATTDVIVCKKANPKLGDMLKVDLLTRPTNSAQDLLRLVPGLFTAQHGGGGKAEQIFLRGFDVDHGTDFAVYVDGMPVNMVSHAHGQGYADMHFVIPETVQELTVYKGTYSAKFGDLATAGAGEFKTKNILDKSQVKLEAGQFNTYRGLAIVDLLQGRHLFTKGYEGLYVASEYKYADGYFDASQHFNRFNIFSKYYGMVNDRTSVSVTLSTFRSRWDASGQIPTRKVTDGTISRFGSLDDSEGGNTSRTNVNLKFITQLKNHSLLSHQLYYTRYNFNLYSNFTFFLKDSINGDGIRQTDDRHMAGYNATYSNKTSLLGKDLESTYGAGFRYDYSDITLAHETKRVVRDTVVSGLLHQANSFAYTDQALALSAKFKVNAGLRLDYYLFDFHDVINDTASGKTTKARISPKMNFSYTPTANLEFFIRSGFGFHSNDARAVVLASHQNALPRALGYETGVTARVFKRHLINLALWSLDLQNELVYVGDEGVVEIAGRTRRRGIDLGTRSQITKELYLDFDINYNKGWLRDEPVGANRIPLAPWLTSTAGLAYKKSGFTASLRYRYIADRPANEENTVRAKGYFLLDGFAGYAWKKFDLGLTAENLLNAVWNEAQFDTESRLQNEPAPVSELHFTPGSPRFLKASIAYNF